MGRGNISKSPLMWKRLGTPGMVALQSPFLFQTSAVLQMPGMCLLQGSAHRQPSWQGGEAILRFFCAVPTSCTICVPCWANYWLKVLLGKGKHVHYVAVSLRVPWISIDAVWKSHFCLVSLCACHQRVSRAQILPGGCPPSLPMPVCHPVPLHRELPGQERQGMDCRVGGYSYWWWRC